MIERYTRPEMGKIWELENKYRRWLDVEVAVCESMAELGLIPEEAAREIREKADFDVARIDEIEKETKHDVIAFLTNVAEYVGDAARYIHLGLTSSDILDTAFALQLKEASAILKKDIEQLLKTLKRRAFEHKRTVMIGRSHGIHAEPITFGLKLALWYSEMTRNLERLKRATECVCYGKISGAVGTYANVDPRVEKLTCKRLGLKPAPISNQIIQRDRYAEYFTTIAIIGGSIEKIATEIRHLQRTEVREVEEYFSKGQKGSSAMPHKRNPIASENMCGLTRVLRGNAFASLENMPLWHERDISHSSVERIIAPDSTILLDYLLNRLNTVLDTLVIYPENMMKNLGLTGRLFFSQQVMLHLTQKGVSREEAYKMVQRNAMKAWEEGRDLKDILLEDEEVMSLVNEGELESIFDLGYHLKHVDTIFEQVFGEKGAP